MLFFNFRSPPAQSPLRLRRFRLTGTGSVVAMPLDIDGGIAARFFYNALFKIPLQGGPNAGLYLIRPTAAVHGENVLFRF